MMTALEYLRAYQDPSEPIIRPEALTRLGTVGHPDLNTIAEALADDLMRMVPVLMGVRISLSQFGEEAQAERDSATAGGEPAVEVMYRGEHFLRGNTVLRMPVDHIFKAAEHYGIMWALTLTRSILDRRALNELESARQFAELRFDATFEHAPVGIAHVSVAGDFLLVNDHFVRLMGRSREFLMENGFQAITHPDDLDDDLAHIRRLLSGKADRYVMEKRYVQPNGDHVWVNLTVALVRDVAGRPDYFISVIEDLSEMKRAKAEATRDPLTGLLNRRGLLERLRRELARAAKSDRSMMIVYLDLDDFKCINDEYGHASGDECLIAVADALVAATRPGDTIARMGGDEFVLLLPELDQHEDALIERLTVAIATANLLLPRPIMGSFGAVNTNDLGEITAEMLIAAADNAMFEAKRQRNRARAV